MRNSQNPDQPHRARRILAEGLARFIVLLGLLLVPSATAPADSSTLGKFVLELESSYRGVRTLRAEFTQTYDWGGTRRVESGTVYFARGGWMRWDYHQPQEKLFVSDGKKLLLYVPAEKQLTRSSVKSSEDVRVPFRLLLSRLNLSKVFSKMEFADQALRPEPGNRVLRAFPKQGYEEDYREVLIELSPALDIRRLVVFYPDRSTMEFTFDRIERNVTLNPALFRFTAPSGTEIIEQP